MNDLTETCISSTHIYTGKLLDVWSDTVRLPDGKTTVREYIKHPGAAVVIPLLPDKKILLIRQYRYPVGETEIELPAGKMDPGETPEETMHRELEEETGYRPGKLTRLGEIRPCIGYSTERMWLFLAEELSQIEQKSDDASAHSADKDEFVELLPASLEQCMEWIRIGIIGDVKTIIGLFWAEKILSKTWQLSETQSLR